MRFSRFNYEVQTEDGNFIVCNSLTGAILKIDESHYTSIKATVQNNNFIVDQENSMHKNLISRGILVEDLLDIDNISLQVAATVNYSNCVNSGDCTKADNRYACENTGTC